MEEAPENSKELSHSAHASGMNERKVSVMFRHEVFKLTEL
jgi:hypothetical protein